MAFNLSTFSDNKTALLEEIESITYDSGYTNIADALCLLLKEGFTVESGARLSEDDVLSIAILITDGQSMLNSTRCDDATTLEVAESIHNSPHPILIFPIGVTDNVNEEQLLTIARKEEYVTYLQDFSGSEYLAAQDKQLYELCTKSKSHNFM